MYLLHAECVGAAPFCQVFTCYSGNCQIIVRWTISESRMEHIDRPLAAVMTIIFERSSSRQLTCQSSRLALHRPLRGQYCPLVLIRTWRLGTEDSHPESNPLYRRGQTVQLLAVTSSMFQLPTRSGFAMANTFPVHHTCTLPHWPVQPTMALCRHLHSYRSSRSPTPDHLQREVYLCKQVRPQTSQVQWAT